jgi:hypothetical protein
MVAQVCEGDSERGVPQVTGSCQQAAQLCMQTADPTDRMYWFYEGPPGVPNPAPQQWVQTGPGCLAPGQAGGQAAVVPVVTGEDFRRLPLPAGHVHVQPGSGRTLVNVATNVYVEASVAVLPTTVLGFPVRVRATPVEYQWTFGDGQSLRTADAGAPYPELRTTHIYLAPGSVRLGLTTVYRGQYSVADGPWLAIAGTASVASPAQPLTVIAARAELVDDTVPAA